MICGLSPSPAFIPKKEWGTGFALRKAGALVDCPELPASARSGSRGAIPRTPTFRAVGAHGFGLCLGCFPATAATERLGKQPRSEDGFDQGGDIDFEIQGTPGDDLARRRNSELLQALKRGISELGNCATRHDHHTVAYKVQLERITSRQVAHGDHRGGIRRCALFPYFGAAGALANLNVPSHRTSQAQAHARLADTEL